MLKSFLKKSRDLQRINDRLKIFLKKRQRGDQIESYLSSHAERKLHLGCGTNFLEGWFNTDQSRHDPELAYLDVTETFPLPDQSFDYILAEHIIEHISRLDAERMIAECFRILRPNGVLRIGTPDLERYLSLYRDPPSEIGQDCIRDIFDSWIFPGFHKARQYAPASGDYSPIFVVNDIFMNYEHRFLYDYALLRKMTLAAGFGACTRNEAGSSIHAPLNRVETHVDRVNTHLTVTIEAVKTPASR
ncbi:MAG TPA: methyltransferase domain-containing protein [Lacunisphaera sp.]|jgi:SAM-dependent methyltransferase